MFDVWGSRSSVAGGEAVAAACARSGVDSLRRNHALAHDGSLSKRALNDSCISVADHSFFLGLLIVPGVALSHLAAAADPLALAWC